MRDIFRGYAFRHALSAGSAVLIALIASHYFFEGKSCWMILSSLLVCQTTRGTSLRQGIYFLLLVSFAVLIGSLLSPNLIYVLFIMSGCLILFKRLEKNTFSFSLLLFIIVLLIAALLPIHESLQTKIIAILSGGFIGILAGYFVFPVNLYAEFQQGLLPILNSLIEYFQAYADCINQENILDVNILSNKKNNIEKKLLTQYGLYPEWIYEHGFNPGLRSGFRFFLITLEQITEILFSMSQFFNFNIDENLLHRLRPLLVITIHNNNNLLSLLKDSFLNKSFVENKDDYYSDIQELENTLRHVIPANLVLLEISSDYVLLTELVRNVKDVRELLLSLLAALPGGE